MLGASILPGLLLTNMVHDDGQFKLKVPISDLISIFQQFYKFPVLKHNFTGPLLSLAGEKSIHTCQLPSIKEGRSIDSFFEGVFTDVTVKVVKDGGHLIHVTHCQDVAQLISKFLQ